MPIEYFLSKEPKLDEFVFFHRGVPLATYRLHHQNTSMMRLVQRKFAQGVPIPASSGSAAPTPPERKPDPPRLSKNVYHNKMSAGNLLDIVSMQNIHKHKQEPLVVLERLREDEIPFPAVPVPVASGRCVRPRIRVPLRRRKVKGNNGNMCLRSDKRKSTEAGKGPSRKRKKLSSESTDDIPLVYYFNNRPAKPHNGQQKNITDKKEKPSVREKRAATQKKRDGTRERSDVAVEKPTSRAESKDERSFTFKTPSSPARLSYRLYKKAPIATGRQLKKEPPMDARWSSLRSARAPSVTSCIARRLRNKVLLGKKPPKPAVRKAGPKTNKDDTAPPPLGPTGFKVPQPPPSESSYSMDSLRLSLTSPAVFDDSTFLVSLKIPAHDEISAASPDLRRASLDSIERFLAAKEEVEDFIVRLPSPVSSVALSNNEVEDWCIPPIDKAPHSTMSESDYSTDLIQILPKLEPTATPEVQHSQSETDVGLEKRIDEKIDDVDVEKIDEQPGIEKNQIDNNKVKKDEDSEKAEQKHERDKEDKEAEQKDESKKEDKKAGQKDESDKDKNAGVTNERDKEEVKPDDKTKMNKGKGVGKKTVQKEKRGRKPKAGPVKEKKTLPKRAAKAAPPQEEAPANTRLLRNSREPPPANPDVYEFDELEASRPPSGLRRRNQPTPDPPSQNPESTRYMDVCPTSTRLVKINTKKEEIGNVFSASLVSKYDIYKKQKNLIDNLSNSPALLNKFINCLPTELQHELGIGNVDTEGNGREEAYLEGKAGTVLEAPTYYPTAEEFEDPIKYYDKIAPEASKYGLCKIVPPESFKPTCTMSDTIRFAVIYQYISKMYSRWGPVSRELAAIKAHLRTQSVVFARSPLLDGSEVDLPKLFHAVERNGGLSNVIQRKRWGRVADEMKLTKLQHPERKLDPIYMRYLLPYAALSGQERQTIMAEVEKCWTTKYQKMLDRARNPFQRQNRLLGTECESESDDEGEDTAGALHEAEDSIVQGRTMNLVTFKKIATSLMDAHFEPAHQPPAATDVEKAYWRAVLLATEHIVANTASIDTGEEGYGFPKDPQAEYGAHPWNLKVLARNPNNVLRYLGPVLGVTVPTLHLGMLFSTSCWHRDPHGLPWTEYMHSGAEKIWYGIPRDESINFRRAVETLCPAYCQNKSIWLASEITMVPPNILSEHGVKLSRLLQRPGEYVMVFPEAHSCSITTGFGISESVYFASNAWLTDVYKLFQELRKSCEPTMFSLEQLLLNGSADSSAPYQVCSVLATLLNAELEHRRALEQKGLKVQERPRSSAPLNTSYFRAWNTRDQDECEYCRSTLFLSKVTGLTGRKSAVCTEHALRLLETKKHRRVDLHTLELLSSFTTPALEEMLERLESRTAGDRGHPE